MVLRGHKLPCSLGLPGGCACLPEAEEVRRDRVFPVTGCAATCRSWSIYIDNLDLWETFDVSEALALAGSTSPFMEKAEEAYLFWNSPGSPEDAVDRAQVFKLLGVVNDGVAGKRMVPTECFGRLVSLLLYLMTSPRVSKRDLQVGAGRSLRFILRNRATMISLDNTWRWIASWQGRRPVPAEVASEFLSVMCLLPLCVTDLRRSVSGVPAATDASYGGGGACIGTRLTASGMRRSRRLRSPVEQVSGTELGIFSLFDGIGGARRACELLDMPVGMFVSVEIEPRRQRVCKSHWPHVIHYSDVTKITAKEIRSLRRRFPRVKVLIAGGGFPCRDMSRLRGPGRAGVRGVHSGLVTEIARIWKLLRRCWPTVSVRKFAENVSSSFLRDVISVNRLLGCRPILIEAGEIGWVRRGRYYWVDWPVVSSGSSTSRFHDHCQEVNFKIQKPPCRLWLDPGASWCGEATGRPLPTFIRHVPRLKRPSDPRGIDRASATAKRRWEADGFAEVVAHYEDHNMVLDAKGHLRLASVAEKEKLHLLKRNHTLAAMKSSEAKSNPRAEYAERASMIGDGFQHAAVAFVFGHLFAELGYLSRAPEIEEILQRRVWPLHVTRGADVVRLPAFQASMSLAERVVRWYVSRTDLRGSDVRLCEGELLKPHHVSRQSSEPHMWRWRTTMSWAWKRANAHINELEALAVLMELRRRSRSTRNFDCTYLHLCDSQVAIGVFTKRRSSSRLLQRVITRANALCLASGLFPVFIYVRSELNPADRPSRRFDHKARDGEAC